MDTILTKYGVLKGVVSAEFYAYGNLKECILDELNEIETSYGKLVPNYEDGGVRHKYNKSISFYESGELKSIALQEQKIINTSIGNIPAELLTFHINGNIKRVFPLNGKITGYWTENDEYIAAKEIDFKFSFGSFKKKVVSVQLYDNGTVKSITFWTKDKVKITSPIGDIEIRNGISLYDTGEIKSVEPFRLTIVDTPIGKIKAYDTDALGIHGETNSLCFFKDGKIKALVSATDEIEVTDKYGNKSIVTYTLKQNLFDIDVMDVVPLRIEFYDNRVRFNNDTESDYEIETSTFLIKQQLLKIKSKCSSCSGCEACG